MANVLVAPRVDLLEALSRQEMLQKALDALDDRFKETFLMVFLEELSCKETAEQLDIPLGTVLSRIHRARLFLRKFLSDLDEAPDELACQSFPDRLGNGHSSPRYRFGGES